MSLDVYLSVDHPIVRSGSGIFVRENGSNVEISREEWNCRRPDRDPVAVCEPTESSKVYSANITHNLCKMASEAGIYYALWRPDEHGIAKASQLIEPLESVLVKLRAEPEHYRRFNPANGWGSYEGLVRFVELYLEACREYPDAAVSVCR